MYPDLESAWIAAPDEERAWYLGPAWRAASHEQRAAVLREDASRWLEAAWRACTADQRRWFVAGWAREVAAALGAALLRLPPEPRPASKTALARRLNSLERKFPHMAEICRAWRAELKIPAGFARGMSPEMRERDRNAG
jgi:hypothetical protein